MGCPKCGNTDIQVLELLEAWKEIERLQDELQTDKKTVAPVGFVVPATANVDFKALTDKSSVVELSSEEKTWKERYDKIKEAYIRTRLEVSGSFGNWSGDTRRRVLEHEISAELGFTI